MPRLSTFLAVLTASIFMFACSDPTADILIENVNIVHVEADSVQNSMSIAIRNDAIIDVFKPGTKNYETENIVDGTDKYAMPGLWDMHVHFRGGDSLELYNKKMLPLYIANGITGVRDAGGDLTKSIISWKFQVNSRYVIGPRLYYSGPKLDGPNARWDGSLELESPYEVSAALDSLDRLNADYVKIYDSTLDSETYMAILTEAEKRGLKVTGHMPMTVMLDDALDAGLDGIEHMYYVLKGCSSKEAEITERVRNGELGFWSAIEALLNTYDQEKAEALFQKMADYEVYVTPTLFINKTIVNLAEEDHSNDPYLRYLSNKVIKTYEGRVNSAKRQSADARAFRNDLYIKFLEMVPMMHEAGVPILAGSDAGAYNSYVYPGPSLHEELKLMGSTGISNADVLQIATQAGPKFLDADNIYGKVEAGRFADMLLLNSNPLENLENLQDIYGVNFGSFYMSRDFLDKLMERVRRPDFIGI